MLVVLLDPLFDLVDQCTRDRYTRVGTLLFSILHLQIEQIKGLRLSSENQP